jgi:hypothetical protein
MTKRTAWLALLLLATPAAARAGGVSGSKPMLCAVTEARDCAYGGDCVATTTDEINLPSFVVVDAKAKLLSEYRGERKTPVQTVAEMDGSLVLQGYENRAWSISISKESGKLLAASTGGADGAFVISGICTDL